MSPVAESGAEAKRKEDLWAIWIARAAQGEREALSSLYDVSSSLLFGLALRLLKDTADAEEVVSDVFTHVWRHGSDFDGSRGSGAAWLVMLVRSRSLDRLRARVARQRAEEPVRQESHVTIDDPLAARESERVRRALDQLPADQRLLIEHAYFGGMSQSELAEKFGLPLGTVKTRTRMALSRLRELLQSR